MDKDFFKTHPLTISKTAAKSLTGLNLATTTLPIDKDEIKPFEFRMLESSPFFVKNANADLSLPLIFFDDKPIGGFANVNNGAHNLVMLANIPDKIVGHVNKRIEALSKHVTLAKKLRKQREQERVNAVYDYFNAQHDENDDMFRREINITKEDFIKAISLVEDIAPFIKLDKRGIHYYCDDEDARQTDLIFSITNYRPSKMELGYPHTRLRKAGRILPVETVAALIKERAIKYDERLTPEIEAILNDIRTIPYNNGYARMSIDVEEAYELLRDNIKQMRAEFDVLPAEYEGYSIIKNGIRLMTITREGVISELIMHEPGQDYNAPAKKMISWIKDYLLSRVSLNDMVSIEKIESEINKDGFGYS